MQLASFRSVAEGSFAIALHLTGSSNRAQLPGAAGGGAIGLLDAKVDPTLTARLIARLGRPPAMVEAPTLRQILSRPMRQNLDAIGLIEATGGERACGAATLVQRGTGRRGLILTDHHVLDAVYQVGSARVTFGDAAREVVARVGRIVVRSTELGYALVEVEFAPVARRPRPVRLSSLGIDPDGQSDEGPIYTSGFDDRTSDRPAQSLQIARPLRRDPERGLGGRASAEAPTRIDAASADAPRLLGCGRPSFSSRDHRLVALQTSASLASRAVAFAVSTRHILVDLATRLADRAIRGADRVRLAALLASASAA